MFCVNYPKTICFLFSFFAFVILLYEQVPFLLQSLIFCDRIRIESNTNSYNALKGISSLLCGGFEASSEKDQTSDPFERIQLQSPDRTIRATFIPFGATLTELWVQDRNNIWRDVVLGYDDPRMYKDDPVHPYFGSVVGRYANRIKNGRFKIDNTIFQTSLNENNQTTLHGGKVGFDRKTFKVEHRNSSSITFILYDQDGNQGFPASILVRIRYSLENNAKFITMMDAEVMNDKKTPIMLSSHIYWALHGYTGNHDTILDHQLHLPKANKYIRTDEDLIPTGEIASVKQIPLDFQSAKTFSETFDQTQNLCGKDCTGWDTCLVMDNHDWDDVILTLTSPETGIRMNVKTDQTAIQLYTCNAIYNKNFNVTRKHVHGDKQIYENHSCLVIELEDYIDAINNPQWGKDQIYSNQKPFHWQTEYSFSQHP